MPNCSLLSRDRRERSSDYHARSRLRQLSSRDYQLTVHNYLAESLGILVRVCEVRLVLHLGRIENYDVGFHARPQQPTIQQAQALGWIARHLAYRIFQRQNFAIANIACQDSRESAIAARMRRAFSKLGNFAIGPDHGVWRSEDALHVLF